MGCVSSKHLAKEIKQDILQENEDDYPHHVVSLTSSTIGVLKLDKEINQELFLQQSVKKCLIEVKKTPPHEELEVINAWELMKGLEEEEAPVKKSPKSRNLLRGFVDLDVKTPLKFLSQVGFSPRKSKRSVGKENFSPNCVVKPRKSIDSPSMLRIFKKGSPNEAKRESIRTDSGMVLSRRKSLSPLFHPELVESLEKELSEEEEQIKKMVLMTPFRDRDLKAKNLKASESFLEMYDKKCPPGGENGVIFYTTTLRGIRKTFEDCNTARSIIESYHVQTFERDVSMDSGFKEELRKLMGTKDVKVPLMFVKGRLIGGVDEIMKLDEEGKLVTLFSGIPKATAICEGCAGIRFIMCMDCNGSSKALGEDGRKSMKCGECNENGLIHCPICS